jgi:uncharacterized protein (DUF362 family)
MVLLINWKMRILRVNLWREEGDMRDDCWNRDYHRRRFMRTAAGAAAFSALAPGALHARKKKEDKPQASVVPPTRVYPDMPDALVSVRGIKDSIEDAVREAVLASGGLEDIEKGQRVMIKPNICGPAINNKIPGRITTNPEVVRAVIRLCKERGASEIYVGDRGMLMTEKAMKWAGFQKVCDEEGAIAFPWTRAEYTRFMPGKRHWSVGFRYPKILDQVDHFINVPLLKHHMSPGAQITCCLKSFVGVCHPEDRHLGGSDELHLENIGEKIAELNLAAKPTINIVDATDVLVNGGPDGLRPKSNVRCKIDLILASRDRVACDSVGLAIMKRYAAENKVDQPYVEKSVWDHAQIYYSAELGIGQAESSRIKIEDVNVPLFDEIKDNWI